MILLRISVLPDGGWLLALGTPGQGAVEARVPPSAVAALVDAAAALTAPPAFLIPGDAADWEAAEEAWGQQAAALLFADPELSLRVGAAGEGLVLALDAADPVARRLPWELLATSPRGKGIEALGRGLILRLSAMGSDRPPQTGHRLRTLLWCPTPEDPVCAARLAALPAELRADTVSLQALPALSPGEALLLHIVCHGEAEASGFLLQLDEVTPGPGAVGALLGPLLRRAELVLLDVCFGGDTQAEALDGLAPRLLAAGAGAVVAPQGRVGADATVAFAEGLRAALTEGAPLGAAVAEGRRRVRALGLSHPEARPQAFPLSLSRLDRATTALLRRRSVHLPWPPGAPEGEALLEAALRSATGWLGLEHLALAQSPQPALSSALGALRPWSGRPPETGLRLSPRLEARGAALPAGWGPDDLLNALPWAPAPPGEAATALEVVGGPEDGLLMPLTEGLTLQRQGEAPGLYGSASVHDPALSRKALARGLPGGRLRVERGPLYLLRAATSDSVDGTVELGGLQVLTLPTGVELELRAGDLLVLTTTPGPAPTGLPGAPVTRLRGRP